MVMRNSWPPMARLLVMLASLLAVIWFAVQIAPLLQVLVVSGLLTYLLNPLAAALARRTRLEYTASVRVVFFGGLALLIALPAVLGTVAWQQLGDLILQQFGPLWQEILARLSQPFQIFGFSLLPEDWVNQALQALAATLPPLSVRSLGWLTDLSQNILSVLLVFVCTYYLLLDGPGFVPWLVKLLPTADRPEVRVLIARLDHVWRIFLRAQLLIFVILAVLMSLGTVGVLMLFQTGLLDFSWLLLVILLVVVYSAVQQVDNLWLRPLWMGRELSLHPGIVFAGLLAALLAGGLLAALLIVPAIASARVLLGYLYRKLLDLEPWPEEVYGLYIPGPPGASEDDLDPGEDSLLEQSSSSPA